MQHRVKLVLASASPRRAELLTAMGVPFSIERADVDEAHLPDEPPTELVRRLAGQKAKAIQHRLKSAQTAVLSADTIVVKDGEVFSKPVDRQDAYRIWRTLADDSHQVMTAVCLLHEDQLQLETVTTDVVFSSISDAQMQRYWASGEPLDKAGAYAIQGLASAWVKLIHGSYSNVVGLPLHEVNRLLARINLNWL